MDDKFALGGIVGLVLGVLAGLWLSTMADAISVPEDHLPPDPAPVVTSGEFEYSCVVGGGVVQYHHDKHGVVNWAECVGGDKNGWIFQVDSRYYAPFKTEK